VKKLFLACAVSAAAIAPAAASAADPTPSDFKNAAKYCKALKAASGSNNFVSMFGTKKNAYGKCVSSTAKQQANEDAKQKKAAKASAAKECKAEREDATFAGAHGGKTFAQFYGTGRLENAYGRCVSQKAKQHQSEADEEDDAEQGDRLNAAKTCRAERADSNFADTHGGKTFAQFYGTGRLENAFGKCVSQTAKELAAERKAESTPTP